MSMIEELQPGQNEITEVKNGGLLKEAALALQPELAFVDISMPICSGLEAINACRDQTPDSLWVILTCFAEFAYAQDAIKAGVSNYLLKPIDTDQLQKVLALAGARSEQKRQKDMEAFGAASVLLYNEGSYDASSAPMPDMPLPALSVYVLTVDNKADASHAMLGEIKGMLRARAIKQAKDDELYASFFSVTGEICIITAGNDPGGFADSIVRPLCNLSSYQQTDSAVYLHHLTSLKDAVAAVDTLCAAAKMRCLRGFGEVVAYSVLKNLMDSADCQRLCELAENAALCYSQQKKTEYLRTVSKLTEYAPLTARYEATLKRYFSLTLDLPADAGELVEALRNHADDMFSGASRQDENIADKICAFVNDNYASDIGINTIADDMGLTPNYLSSVFKQKTGMRFIDYLTQVRMDNARRLLLEQPGLPVKDVAQSVGYFSQRHFSKLFQAQVGCNPSQYKKGNAADGK